MFSGVADRTSGALWRKGVTQVGFGVSLILFCLNLFRVNPEVLPPAVAVFWLDAVILVVALGGLLLAGVVGHRVRSSVLFLTVLAVGVAMFPVFWGGAEDKLSYAGRVIYLVVILPLVFSYWFVGRRDAVLVYSKVVVISAAPMAIIVFFQLFPAGLVSEAVHWLWGTDKLRSFSSGNPRAYGAFYNANWFGVYVVSLFLSIFYLWSAHVIRWPWAVVALLLGGMLLIASGSRTAFVGLIVALAMCWVWVAVNRGFLAAVRVVSVSVFAGGALVAWFFSVADDVILRRWREFGSGEGVSSASRRVDTWMASWEGISESPWFGAGVSGTPHNSYLATLEAFGLIFGAVLLGIYALVVLLALARISEKDALLVVPMIVSFSVMAGTAEFLYTTQLMVLMSPLFIWAVWPAVMGGVESRHRLGNIKGQ